MIGLARAQGTGVCNASNTSIDCIGIAAGTTTAIDVSRVELPPFVRHVGTPSTDGAIGTGAASARSVIGPLSGGAGRHSACGHDRGQSHRTAFTASRRRVGA